MSTRPVIDVSGLPDVAFGHRDPLWWGIAGLIVIEGTTVVLLVASFVYLRGNYHEWPPTGFGLPVQLVAATEAILLLASAWPNHRMTVAVLDGSLRRARRWLAVTTALGFAFCALRAVLFAILPFRWDLHAYASCVWALLVLNFLHALTGTLENAVMLALTFKGPFERKHLVDVHSTGFLWYFVIWAWIPVYALVFLFSRFIRSGA